MSHGYEACIADAFLTFFEKGYVYRGLKPVYWCIHDHTALAEAEVEYEDHISPSIWVRYRVTRAANGVSEKHVQMLYALVWTTTPWTLPASMALAFHPSFDYVLAADEQGDVYIVAEQLLESAARETGLRLVAESAQRFPGTTFALTKFQHPFLDRVVPGVLAKHVTLEQGSGIVHTAPGHGAEDFQVGQEYGLETYAPVDDDGRFTEGLPEYKGKTVFEANPRIIELLKSRGALVAEGKLQHSYPHCWRCHNPVIFRATEQWFIHLDGDGAQRCAGAEGAASGSLRVRALEEIPKVQWTPEWGARAHSRDDRGASRLVHFAAARLGRASGDFLLRRMRRDSERFRGAAPSHTLVRTGRRGRVVPRTRPKNCSRGHDAASAAARTGARRTDILDVWFDSGSSHLAVLDPPGTPDAELPWPADMYLEGPDQYRGWFHSSLLIGVAVRDAAPYRHVLTHGWTLDEHGRPMSKSLGNTVLPTEVCEKWGADLLRLWVASQDYHSDVRMSDERDDAAFGGLPQDSQHVPLCARQSCRFRSGTRRGAGRLNSRRSTAGCCNAQRGWSRTAEAFYARFDFHRVYHAVHDFCVVDLSAFYFDILKDRLYTLAARSFARRSAQTAIYRIASALVRMLAPMLVFTAEEIWQHLPKLPGEPPSVHLALFPKVSECRAFPDEALDARWEHLREVRTEVLKALEQARTEKRISGSLEARVVLFAGNTLAELLEQYGAWLPALFIVSQVEFAAEGPENAPPDAVRSEAMPHLAVAVRRADGAKCDRCWNYSARVGENADYPTVCERCVAALEQIEGAAPAGVESTA